MKAEADRKCWSEFGTALLGLSTLFLLLNTTASAEVASWHGPWRGLDLYVQVVTRGHPLNRSAPEWWTWGDRRRDTYLFGFGTPGVDLALEFSAAGGKPQATVRTVPLKLRSQVVALSEGYTVAGASPKTLLPAATLTPLKGDWTTGSLPNFELSGTINTPAPFVLRVGSSVPGRPTWTTSTRAGMPDLAVPGPQFGAAVQEDLSVPYELAAPLLPGFPSLSAGPEDQFYGPNKPLFYVTDKRELQTRYVGFQTAGVYAVNSYSRPPALSFEAPFAWYRFDPAAGRFPNMTVRVEQFPAGYRNAPVPDAQRTAARISWTSREAGKWRYSVSVVGDHPLDRSVQIGNVTARSVPYGELPGWIAAQLWQGASFVEATSGFSGSEGIYSYSVEANPDLFKWVNGASDAPPDTFALPYLGGLSVVSPNLLPEGFRGEYSLVYNRRPQLYLSATDNRVHLEHAQAGIWNLGAGLLLRSADLNGDGHTDSWRVERQPSAAVKTTPQRAIPGKTEQSLAALDGYLIVSDAAGVAVGRAPDQSDRPLPLATDAANWSDFLAAVPQGSGRDPRQLRSWLTGGASATLDGAGLSGLRPTADGFRFVLNAPGKATPTRPVAGLNLSGALGLSRRGTHVLHYVRTSGRWSVLPATAPALDARVTSEPLRAYTPTTLTLTLNNSGTLDQTGPARLLVNGREVVSWPDLRVPAQGQATRQVRWTPEGRATHRFTVNWKGGVSGAGTLVVQAPDRISGLNALDLSAPFGDHGLIDLLLIAACALGGLWLVWRRAL